MHEAIRRLAVHMQWADQQVLASLRDCGNPPARALTTFAHVLGSEHTWLRRIAGRPTTHPVWPSLDLTACEALARDNHAELQALLATLSASDPEQSISYVNTKGVSFESRLGDILLHMSLHGCYHRGQVALLLRLEGFEPVPTDYIVHTREP